MRITTALLLGSALAGPGVVVAQDQSEQPSQQDSQQTAQQIEQPGSQKAPYLPPLDPDVIKASVDTLQEVLYNLVELKQDTHQAHWNVVGSDYYQLHEFYQELYTGLEPYLDQTAERIRALGPAADARLGPTSEATTIPPIEPGELQGANTNRVLAEKWKIMSTNLYDAQKATDEDIVTQDLFTSISHFVDKSLWQLWAHLQPGQ